jgi:NAD(P)-dependent dehydrogenase (short-subunit alcohol dehydrogenase family)
MDAFALDGKVAIITGASRGIGEAIARTYAKAGAKVVLSARKVDSLNQTAESIQAEGGDVIPVAAHTGDPNALNDLVEATIAKYGGVDILVNNAATNPHFGPLLTSEESMWDKTLEVNLRGYFRLIRAAVPSMQKRGGGKIINIASIVGLTPMPGMGLYGITKAAVIMMTKTLAAELGSSNIQINAIAPGFVKTRFSQAIWGNDAISANVIRATPSRRIAEPDEITGIALYLASPASNFTTGQVFVVDGGLTVGTGMLS